MEDVIGRTLSLFAMDKSSEGKVTPMCLLSLIDPKASWFSKWMVRGGRCGISGDVFR